MNISIQPSSNRSAKEFVGISTIEHQWMTTPGQSTSIVSKIQLLETPHTYSYMWLTLNVKKGFESPKIYTIMVPLDQILDTTEYIVSDRITTFAEYSTLTKDGKTSIVDKTNPAKVTVLSKINVVSVINGKLIIVPGQIKVEIVGEIFIIQPLIKDSIIYMPNTTVSVETSCLLLTDTKRDTIGYATVQIHNIEKREDKIKNLLQMINTSESLEPGLFNCFDI